MFAIIQSGGRQLRVEEDSVVTIDHVDQSVGEEVTFDRVLFVDDDGTCIAGDPFITSATAQRFVSFARNDVKRGAEPLVIGLL